MSTTSLPPPEKKPLLGNSEKPSSSLTSNEVNEPVKPVFRKSDEVCKIRNGQLIFGILEYPIKGKNREWSVRWNFTDFNGCVYNCPLITTESEDSLTFTDRPIYKGCKVRKADGSSNLVGICRDVRITADVRIVGTTTIIESASIDEFCHLKEFKQKSVVYKSGWLGVVTEVSRLASVRFATGENRKIKLQELLRVGPLQVETPWINEEIYGRGFRPSSLPKPNVEFSNLDPVDPAVASTSTEESKTKSVRRIFIEDLEVESVKVLWRFQVDAMRPDKPPEEIKGTRLKDLKIVMEELSSETTYQVGNLGKFKIRIQTDFHSLKAYNKSFVQRFMNPEKVDDLKFITPTYAYDKTPENKLTPDTFCVVEIIHTNTMGDIIWQDGRMEFVSGKDLIVQDESLLDSILTLGDFLYSEDLRMYGSPDEIYAVVNRYNIEAKQVALKVLSTKDPTTVVKNDIICLPERSVARHPKYKYFNEFNTVVVLTRNGGVFVGHVLRTNPAGKVLVLWLNGKEEWIYPAECSVYNVKGHDLECIISLINDEDEMKEIDLTTKLHCVIQKLHYIQGIWNETIGDGPEQSNLLKIRRDSLPDLRKIILDCRELEAASSENGKETHHLFSEEAMWKYSTKIEALFDENKDRSLDDTSIYAKHDLMESVASLCTHLRGQADELMNKHIETRAHLRSFPHDMNSVPSTSCKTDSTDLPIAKAKDGEPMEISAPESDLNQNFNDKSIFLPNVVIEDFHPAHHHFATNEFHPTQISHFVKVVQRELKNLRDQCPSEIKIKAFGSRFDLFSILIGGPSNTPYENSLYIFDVSLPPDYPSSPPKFHFYSYLAGRLNPNLYAEGKVCVSLLGTWHSKNQQERWTKESNLVQVLLSIQALILVKEPYHNEPGQEEDKYTPTVARDRCHQYNTNLIPKIMSMMINQIRNPMEPWKEDILYYYKQNLPLFIGRWEKWLKVSRQVKNVKQFNERLGAEAPEFAVYPCSDTFIKSVESQLSIMKKLLEKLLLPTTEATETATESPMEIDANLENNNSAD